MKIFHCQRCGHPVYFDSTQCVSCGSRLGYLPNSTTVSALEEQGTAWRPFAAPGGELHRFCDNAEHKACNWLVPVASAEVYCIACRHNRTIPNLADAQNVARWRKLEAAKHHLFYSLLRLRLPLQNRTDDPEKGLAFDFLANQADPDGGHNHVLTGHDNGVITINVAEADDAERERQRNNMGEPYRTVLGHFRHEVGHYFWDQLVNEQPPLTLFRELFGDERRDYGEALRRHYATGPPPDWQDRFLTSYASAHPWEDFAESWAHYLHIVDTLETARAFGMRVQPVAHGRDHEVQIDCDPYTDGTILDIVATWLPLTYAVNALNRSMGQPDLYPFVLSAQAVEKLGFVHDLVRRRTAAPM